MTRRTEDPVADCPFKVDIAVCYAPENAAWTWTLSIADQPLTSGSGSTATEACESALQALRDAIGQHLSQ